MLRISAFDHGQKQVLLRLEGRVVGPWATELQRTCESFLSQGRSLELHLAEVAFLDSAGISLMLNLRNRGVQFLDCTSFIAEQLKAVEAGEK